ncbi:MAG TPA: hypothetical protein VK363_08825 [Pyrinomonadaceae bacterium]|nr:hypothetical protein [Pyrinomonadaceae bacterium]
MLEHLTRESLSAQLNTKFRLAPEPEKPIEIELVEVQAHDDVKGQTERFSALFRGPLDYFLPQRTYRMEHEQLGDFELFIVPVRKDDAGFYYEAVFNRVE